MLELEKTYLVKKLPDDLKNYPFKEVVDIYIPENSKHPSLRIRKNGDNYEITKKQPVKEGDASRQIEQTVVLTESEFKEFDSQLTGKRIRKLRYAYKYNNHLAEFDIFQDKLKGLVLVDFEFKNDQEKEDFKMPEFCLAEVTQETFLAGGLLSGKSYDDIEHDLKKFDYSKLNS